MTTLCDLGPGFHLVPIRDHCRVTSTRRFTRPTTWDYMAVLDAPEVRGGSWGSPEWCARRDVALAARVKARNARRQERLRKLKARKRQCALTIADPMALQAALVLRSVLRDLRAPEWAMEL